MGKPWGFRGNLEVWCRAAALGGDLAPGYRFPMLYRFDDFELDFSRMQLRRSGDEIAVEPRPFSLLCLLVQNHDRLISKDEVIEHVWNGRVVSEAAVSTAVKTARRALDDDGDAQTYIRTVPKRGYRFVGSVRLGAAASPAEPLVPEREPADRSALTSLGRKPSVAIVPFRTISDAGTGATIAEALPSELISSLSRLRWLTVLARGSTFRFRNAAYDLTGVRDLLSAAYCVSGDVECDGPNLAINVELADTDSQAVIWSDRFIGKADDVHEIRSQIIANVIASLELHIPQNEVEKTRLRSSEMLDAWGHYHHGVHYMYRFNRADNDIALNHFKRATELDRNFARAFAGLSYAHFQNAFQRFSPEFKSNQHLALDFAERGVTLDPLDPFANLIMGRAQWLTGDVEAGLSWMDRSVEISPNYAFGLYNSALLHAIQCDGDRGEKNVAKALKLSPIDPLTQSMLAARAIACLVRGDDQAATYWAERALRAPNVHIYVDCMGVMVYGLVGDWDAAQRCADNVRRKNPSFGQADFLATFKLSDPAILDRVKVAFSRLGL